MNRLAIQQFLGVFQQCEVVDADLYPVSHNTRLEFVKRVKRDLVRDFEATFNFVSLPAFWLNKPVKLLPMLESKKEGKRTPDYLVVYNGNRVLVECKTSNFNEDNEDRLKKRIEKRIREGKKQLKAYHNYPGVCIIMTNNREVFSRLDTLRDLIQKKIDDSMSNLAALIFTFYRQEKGKGYLDFTVFLNFRSRVLLPAGFHQMVLEGRGCLVISAVRGDQFTFAEIERVCRHYGFDPKLEQLEKLICDRNSGNI